MQRSLVSVVVATSFMLASAGCRKNKATSLQYAVESHCNTLTIHVQLAVEAYEKGEDTSFALGNVTENAVGVELYREALFCIGTHGVTPTDAEQLEKISSRVTHLTGTLAEHRSDRPFVLRSLRELHDLLVKINAYPLKG